MTFTFKPFETKLLHLKYVCLFSGECEEVLISLVADRDSALNQFGYYEILGRYTIVSSSLAVSSYNQLHGRHSFTVAFQKPEDILDLK